MSEATARQWWLAYEPVHAVVYFDPTCRAAMDDVGLRGFWMGYFAGRSAPLGEVGPEVVTALFFNFHPARVRRALPDAWSFASPAAVWSARSRSAAAVLRRVVPGIDDAARAMVPVLSGAFDGIADAGHPLFAATRSVGAPDDPVEALWHWCTCLREHRGDGHVSALTAAGLDGCEALVLFAASLDLPEVMFQSSRGWSADEWEAARGRLVHRGLWEATGTTAAGRQLRAGVEATTDTLAIRVTGAMQDRDRALVFDGLATLSAAVAEAGIINYPNPMGLPAPTGG